MSQARWATYCPWSQHTVYWRPVLGLLGSLRATYGSFLVRRLDHPRVHNRKMPSALSALHNGRRASISALDVIGLPETAAAMAPSRPTISDHRAKGRQVRPRSTGRAIEST